MFILLGLSDRKGLVYLHINLNLDIDCQLSASSSDLKNELPNVSTSSS